MSKTKINSKKQEETDRKLFAFLATFLTIIGFIIALLVKRDDDYVMFYAKQGLVLFIIQIIAHVASWLPLIGWLASTILWFFFLIVWVLAWINAISGEKRDTWLISNYAKKIKI